jgi:hypothetical protein
MKQILAWKKKNCPQSKFFSVKDPLQQKHHNIRLQSFETVTKEFTKVP